MSRARFMIHIDQALKNSGLPLLGIAVFLSLWQLSSARINTSLGQFPGPAMVWEQAQGLLQEYRDERQRELDFYTRQEKRIAAKKIQQPDTVIEVRPVFKTLA